MQASVFESIAGGRDAQRSERALSKNTEPRSFDPGSVRELSINNYVPVTNFMGAVAAWDEALVSVLTSA